jgi:hypothetical protein
MSFMLLRKAASATGRVRMPSLFVTTRAMARVTRHWRQALAVCGGWRL